MFPRRERSRKEKKTKKWSQWTRMVFGGRISMVKRMEPKMNKEKKMENGINHKSYRDQHREIESIAIILLYFHSTTVNMYIETIFFFFVFTSSKSNFNSIKNKFISNQTKHNNKIFFLFRCQKFPHIKKFLN